MAWPSRKYHDAALAIPNIPRHPAFKRGILCRLRKLCRRTTDSITGTDEKKRLFFQIEQTLTTHQADTYDRQQGGLPSPDAWFALANVSGRIQHGGNGRMATSNLRIYHGPDDDSTGIATGTAFGQRLVRQPVREILPLLADAYSSQRTWLRDFDDEHVTISSDLYEVLLAYQHYRRPSA